MTEPGVLSLKERLEKIKSPNLQNQKETAIVLSAIEDTLRDQGHEFTATAYFAALLALLSQAISQVNGVVNKDLATSIIYLLDTIAGYVPAPLLRSKFPQILTSIAPALTQKDIEAPLLRHAMGCLETLLLAQDTAGWNQSQSQIGPRGAVAGILALAVDHRPKVRKRAQDALTKVLKNPPPSPSLDHPAADMCAESALRTLQDAAQSASKKGKNKTGHDEENHASLIHALKLVKTIASASGGWPSRRIDALCEVLLGLSKSNNEFLSTTSFEVFETIFAGMANETSAVKLPRLLEAVKDLRPSQNDSQLLPPWIAVISRGYDVSAQIDIDETWMKLPEIFEIIASFLSSSSHNIRVSASECLISFTATCFPPSVIQEPSIMDEKVLAKLSKTAIGLLSVKYQGAWMEVFNVLSAMFQALAWQSTPYLDEAVQIVGNLRGNETFAGKKEADAVLGNAIAAAGPEAVLKILPLNLDQPKANLPGRAWLLPLLRDNVMNATLGHFRAHLVPLSESMFQRVLDHGDKEKTMDIKIYETLVTQIWSILPGYCSLPRDLPVAFDQEFAELLANLLYSQTHLRTDVCKALQALVDSNKEVITLDLNSMEEVVLPYRMAKEQAEQNIQHLSQFAANLLAVLFNVYSQTLPHHRGYILQCINSYLSITSEEELEKTFENVTTHLEAALQEQASQTQSDKQKQKQSIDTMPPKSHTLMDLLITLSIYLPRSSYQKLFSVAALLLPQSSDPQLQKKAYKLLPRLASSETGRQALAERSNELQELLLSSAESATAPAKRDRLAAIAAVVEYMPKSSLHFIPSILSQVVVSAKEVNEKARTTAFDLLVQMGKKMSEGGTIEQSKIPHMAKNAPATKASLEEYFTMVSAGLAGSNPHMISASVTALTRILYEFRSDLSEPLLLDLVSTMDLFLTSKNREIVRSVLGFTKVAIISLPDSIITPRLSTMIPSLLSWSHEHKNQFRSKVKHLLERAIRRFGFAEIVKYCPEDDVKLINNIHKTRERRKRNKSAHAGEDEGEDNAVEGKEQRKGRFESEFEEAVYGSGSSDSEGLDDVSDSEDEENGSRRQNGTKHKSKSKSYIIESGNDPLDLLDKKAFASISSTKPVRFKDVKQRQTKAKTDLDGKLIFNDREDDVMSLDAAGNDNVTLEKGINAYVEAIRGQHAAQRGRGGKLKFSNRRQNKDSGDEESDDHDGMDLDTPKNRTTNGRSAGDSGRADRAGRSGGRRGRGGFGGTPGSGFSHKGNGPSSSSSHIKGGRFKVAKHRARQQQGRSVNKGRNGTR